MKTKFARPSRKTRPIRGHKHPGIYGNHKDLAPCPQKVYIQLTWNMPLVKAMRLQELYPDMVLSGAIKQYILDNIHEEMK